MLQIAQCLEVKKGDFCADDDGNFYNRQTNISDCFTPCAHTLHMHANGLITGVAYTRSLVPRPLKIWECGPGNEAIHMCMLISIDTAYEIYPSRIVATSNGALKCNLALRHIIKHPV